MARAARTARVLLHRAHLLVQTRRLLGLAQRRMQARLLLDQDQRTLAMLGRQMQATWDRIHALQDQLDALQRKPAVKRTPYAGHVPPRPMPAPAPAPWYQP